MKILIEGYPYKENTIIPYIANFPDKFVIKYKNNSIALNAVGYFLNKRDNYTDIVFILPKVVLNKVCDTDSDVSAPTTYKVFNKYQPESIIDAEKLTNSEYNFIYDICIWIYKSIKQYDKRYPNNKVCIKSTSNKVCGNGLKLNETTTLDIILAIQEYSIRNKNLAIKSYNQSHYGFNKINWKKTFKKCIPIYCSGNYIYSKTISKKKTTDYNETLFCIFFSLADFLKNKYGGYFYITPNYSLMNHSEFKIFCKKATKFLKSIKCKYFSDQTKELWNLLYYYFSQDSVSSTRGKVNDFFFVGNFQIVFEDMIDFLISDNEKEIPAEFKYQRDGKIVDHLYKDHSLICNDFVYYIGDSKYYKSERDLEINSVAKQFTYAKNIIQRNIDVFFNLSNNKVLDKEKYLRYRDDLTEGYNITPNFFISAILDYKDNIFDFHNHQLKKERQQSNFISMHFQNRLFDRDTLFLHRYSINFLFVISIYAKAVFSKRMLFRKSARKTFKNDIQTTLDTNYSFYLLVITPKYQNQAKEILFKYYYILQGKIFSVGGHQPIILALEKGDDYSEDNNNLLKVLENDFLIYKNYKIGTSPMEFILNNQPYNLQDKLIDKSMLKSLLEELSIKYEQGYNNTEF